MKLVILILVILSQNLSHAATLEDLFDGFERCTFHGAYYNIQTQEEPAPYFKERNLKPYKVESGLAYYAVKDSFYGIPVLEIIIPVTFDVHVLIFDMPILSVRDRLEKIFGNLFENSEQVGSGDSPGLISYKEDENKTVLFCNEREGGF